jgi:glucose-1-phosphatase
MIIRNIIFDLGGVILNIDYQATFQAFKALGVTQFDRFFTQASQINLFDRFDKGEISSEEFRDKIRAITGLPLTDKAIDRAWNAMLLDLPWHRMELLEGVKRNYRTFLLSNTNAIHFPAFLEYLQREFRIDSLDPWFEKQYLSHEIGMRKPDPEVYRHILGENDLDPAQTLFIDDTSQHVEGARQAGLKALWLNTDQIQVTELFNWRYELRPEVSELASRSTSSSSP